MSKDNRKKNQSIGSAFSKKIKKEAKDVGKGVVRAGGKIINGTVKGLLNMFNPFR